MSHSASLMEQCGFCMAIAKLWRTHGTDQAAYNRAADELWDQYERAGNTRRAYGRRHGYIR